MFEGHLSPLPHPPKKLCLCLQTHLFTHTHTHTHKYIHFFFPVALRPNAGHGLLILEVSRSHTTTHHSRQDSSGRVISTSQRLLPDNTQQATQADILGLQPLSKKPCIENLRLSGHAFNRLTPNNPYIGRTALLTSKRCILYIYTTNIGTEYFKHALYSPFFLFKMQFVS